MHFMKKISCFTTAFYKPLYNIKLILRCLIYFMHLRANYIYIAQLITFHTLPSTTLDQTCTYGLHVSTLYRCTGLFSIWLFITRTERVMYRPCTSHVRVMFIFLAEIMLRKFTRLFSIWLLFTRTFPVLYGSCTGLVKGHYYLNKSITSL